MYNWRSVAGHPVGFSRFTQKLHNHWIGLRENLQEPWFLPSNIGLSCKFSHHPILWHKNPMSHLLFQSVSWLHLKAAKLCFSLAVPHDDGHNPNFRIAKTNKNLAITPIESHDSQVAQLWSFRPTVLPPGSKLFRRIGIQLMMVRPHEEESDHYLWQKLDRQFFIQIDYCNCMYIDVQR